MDSILELLAALRQLFVELYRSHVLLQNELLRLGTRHTYGNDDNNSDVEEDEYDGSTLLGSGDEKTS